jgi:hypothetical protein
MRETSMKLFVRVWGWLGPYSKVLETGALTNELHSLTATPVTPSITHTTRRPRPQADCTIHMPFGTRQRKSL